MKINNKKISISIFFISLLLLNLINFMIHFPGRHMNSFFEGFLLSLFISVVYFFMYLALMYFYKNISSYPLLIKILVLLGSFMAILFAVALFGAYLIVMVL